MLLMASPPGLRPTDVFPRVASRDQAEEAFQGSKVVDTDEG
jgi:hypothetical protein